MRGLTDKVVLVTGGGFSPDQVGSGLGMSMCVELAAEGAKVVVSDLSLERAEATVTRVKEAGGDAVAVAADVTDEDSVRAMVSAALDAYGHIDVLVNNAGVFGAYVPLLEIENSQWDRVMEVDLKGVFLATKATLPHMLERGKGVVINVSSASGVVASEVGAEYTTAKHGVIGLTKQIAYDYGHQGIRAVGIGPGVIKTAAFEGAEITSDFPFYDLTMQAPAGRYGEPHEIARAVCFLASDDASFIHGHTIPVDGGSPIR
ncbi:SDR family NAD(P)-dependent oxidoreductase [Micromonospora aurantiaca (nom. illeg.)]|uniref:SDR family NAD(P)-dependent oxidoreductase n=1 Tax=Micromonospora aurantiaca (nom. illeg.) TaxID=47850 RepID=UPI000827B751|nr:glucose 1-dehydrogenase [Micromonospora aurantiaca]MBC9003002.1 glucose 1-dehydrogenase [Micromonospora aurantiaca]SCL41713.1 3-oxoacyl-[acyl-carrier protein] reductase [Micromonospora aurantiaca]